MPHSISSATCFDYPSDLKELSVSDIIPAVMVTVDKALTGEFGGQDLKTPSVSPNNSFLEVR